ncbi:MAG: hypothetical protein JWO24_1687 [Rhodospirillales bacterium]|jgi:alkanesulfonate monooxygenase SsuD/methylene tetrahydromethanopterin reductase-like flavin-dependent oxidoreductase (luciferase family)|nr:hypothetical protein [Rhodospirillales bacterium]
METGMMSDRGNELAARHADGMFGAEDSREWMQADCADIDAQMRAN